uniref:Uncharacterized protein n=1 Tax=Hyaloperonospora arabidopsidis (strain Emoy2) TaxID=559515 RepID=M4BVR3_HYAAE
MSPCVTRYADLRGQQRDTTFLCAARFLTALISIGPSMGHTTKEKETRREHRSRNSSMCIPICLPCGGDDLACCLCGMLTACCCCGGNNNRRQPRQRVVYVQPVPVHHRSKWRRSRF